MMHYMMILLLVEVDSELQREILKMMSRTLVKILLLAPSSSLHNYFSVAARARRILVKKMN